MTPDSSTSPSLLDLLRGQALLFEEVSRIQDLLIDRLLLPALAGARGPEPQGEAGLLELLRRLQRLMLKHPVAAQAAFTALVAEGRRFAATPEGAAWKATLAGSELVRNGRQLFGALSLELLEEDSSTVVPSAYLEALFQAARSPELEALLCQLQGLSSRGGHGTP
jgi:hypothetical protein